MSTAENPHAGHPREDHPAMIAARSSWRAVMANDKAGWLDLMADDMVMEDPIGVAPTNPEGKGLQVDMAEVAEVAQVAVAAVDNGARFAMMAAEMVQVEVAVVPKEEREVQVDMEALLVTQSFCIIMALMQ